MCGKYQQCTKLTHVLLKAELEDGAFVFVCGNVQQTASAVVGDVERVGRLANDARHFRQVPIAPTLQHVHPC